MPDNDEIQGEYAVITPTDYSGKYEIRYYPHGYRPGIWALYNTVGSVMTIRGARRLIRKDRKFRAAEKQIVLRVPE